MHSEDKSFVIVMSILAGAATFLLTGCLIYNNNANIQERMKIEAYVKGGYCQEMTTGNPTPIWTKCEVK